MTLIDGNALAANIKQVIANTIFELKGPRPHLAIILVGARPDSCLYVSLKEKQAKEVGIETSLYKLDETVSQTELESVVEHLNNDETVDDILIQMPLPEHLDTDAVIAKLDPAKDVDGFHPQNLEKLLQQPNGSFLPPLFGAIKACLDSINCKIQGKQICIVGKNSIFTNKLKEWLEQQSALVNVVHEIASANTPRNDNVKNNSVKAVIASPSASFGTGSAKQSLLQADIIITAVGQPKLITADLIKDNAIIIDIGINKDEQDKTCGDVDADSMKNKPGYLTPVPGGIGPLTVALALLNTLTFYQKKINPNTTNKYANTANKP